MSAKQEQILVIDPAIELAFVGPFTSPVSSSMKLSNPSDRKVAFKIKTTAPKRYCVKPNSGVIEPRQTVHISVSLQPFDFDPSEKNRHKFMVQSMFAPDGDINQETLWKETDSNELMDSKLKCVFVLPDENKLFGGGVDSDQGSSSTARSDYQSPRAAPMMTAGAAATLSKTSSSSAGGESNDVNLRRTVEEIKRLQEENSALRQETIQLKEESLRLKRIAASKNSDATSSHSPAAASTGFKPSSSSAGGGGSFSASIANASNPNATALSNTYIYAAVVVLILGIILGKWVL